MRVCASCHGVNNKDQAGNPPPTNSPQALRKLLQHWKSIVDDGGTDPENEPPVVGPIIHNLDDIDPATDGIQFSENTTGTYSSSATDPDNDSLSWEWVYSINGDSEIRYREGVGVIEDVQFFYPLGSAGTRYDWTLRVRDETSTSETSLSVFIVEEPGPDEDPDPSGQGAVVRGGEYLGFNEKFKPLLYRCRLDSK